MIIIIITASTVEVYGTRWTNKQAFSIAKTRDSIHRNAHTHTDYGLNQSMDRCLLVHDQVFPQYLFSNDVFFNGKRKKNTPSSTGKQTEETFNQSHRLQMNSCESETRRSGENEKKNLSFSILFPHFLLLYRQLPQTNAALKTLSSPLHSSWIDDPLRSHNKDKVDCLWKWRESGLLWVDPYHMMPVCI